VKDNRIKGFNNSFGVVVIYSAFEGCR